MGQLKHHQLRALVAVADHGGISAAARALCVTQPAITKALRELELEQGMSLLLRNSWGVTLTEAGQVLLGYARLITSEVQRAQHEMDYLRQGHERRLQVGLTTLLGLEVLPEAFIQFRRHMPEVQVEFLEMNQERLLEGVRTGQLDFVVGAFSSLPSVPFVTCTSLGEYPSMFVVRANSPLREARHLQELQEVEWMHADVSGAQHSFIVHLFQQQGLTPPKRITCCTSNVLFCNLVLSMDVVVPLSSLGVRSTLAADRLVALDLAEHPPSLQVVLLTREGAIISRAAEHFIQCVHNVIC